MKGKKVKAGVKAKPLGGTAFDGDYIGKASTVKAWAVVNYANQVMPFNAYWGSLRIYTNKRSAGISAKQGLGDSKRIEQVMILRELRALPRRKGRGRK